MVSNHGGLAVEGALGSIEVLPEVVDAVGKHSEVYLDGGIRTGGDVLRALALGARAVLIGRPIFWGLLLGWRVGAREHSGHPSPRANAGHAVVRRG